MRLRILVPLTVGAPALGPATDEGGPGYSTTGHLPRSVRMAA
jgi:hypothetical protein